MIFKADSPGAWRGYLKCSIQGTNNQLPNIFYNINHKIVHLQVVWDQIFVFRKSCLSQTEENSCLWSYGPATLVLDFKLTGENGDLLSLRHLKYRTLCKSILKCGFSTKGIELTQFVLFEVVGVPQLWDTSV